MAIRHTPPEKHRQVIPPAASSADRFFRILTFQSAVFREISDKMLPEVHHLRNDIPASRDEVISTLLSGAGFKAEHIVSRGAASPPDFWYDQELPEWVALLTGSASIEFEGGSLHLNAGDHLIIPAHLRHRVGSTSIDATWLALHFEPKES